MSAGADGKIEAKLGHIAPDFALRDIYGDTVRLSDSAGKTILVDFWATWCGPCVAALPHLNQLHQSRGSLDVVVITVNLETSAVAREFVEKEGYGFIAMVDEAKTVGDIYGVDAIPTTFLVDKRGILRERLVGGSSLSLRVALWKERFRQLMDYRPDLERNPWRNGRLEVDTPPIAEGRNGFGPELPRQLASRLHQGCGGPTVAALWWARQADGAANTE